MSSDLLVFSDSDWANCGSLYQKVHGWVCGFLWDFSSFMVFQTPYWHHSFIDNRSGIHSACLDSSRVIMDAPDLYWAWITWDWANNCSVIIGDNTPALSSCKLDTTKGRTKHMDAKVKFLGEVYRQKKFHLKYVASQNNWSDILTKPLATVAKLQEIKSSYSSRPHYSDAWEKFYTWSYQSHC